MQLLCVSNVYYTVCSKLALDLLTRYPWPLSILTKPFKHSVFKPVNAGTSLVPDRPLT